MRTNGWVAGSTEPVTTQRILRAIGDRGSDWPAAFPKHAIEALAAALAREMGAGTIADGALTAQGCDTLAALESAAAVDVGTMTTLTSPPEQWR